MTGPRETLIDIFLHVEGAIREDGSRCCESLTPCPECGAAIHDDYVETRDDAYHVVICERCPRDAERWQLSGYAGHDEYR